jgi:hypothetical protein
LTLKTNGINNDMTNFKALHGRALIDAGYKLVPIKAGAKYPGAKGWPDIRAKHADVDKWAKSPYYGGLGVLGKFTPGIDIDVRDPTLVALLVAWCRDHIGPAPIRTGNPPRVLIPCSPPPGGLGPDASDKFTGPDGNAHQIEIKATGQQWVAYGVHPGTGKPYEWSHGELSELDADWLPVLTGEKIQALFDYFYSIIPAGWVRKERPRRDPVGVVTDDATVRGAVSFENYKPPLHITTDRLRLMLRQLDPDAGHDLWLQVGMALYHQYEGGAEGLDLFAEWSQRSVDYDYAEIQTRWPTWGSGARSPITAASIVALYNDTVKKKDDPTLRRKPRELSGWVKRYGLVEQPDATEVYDMGVEAHIAKRRMLRAFREHTQAYTHRTLGEDGSEKITPMADAWAKSLDTRHFAGYTYQPGDGRYCKRRHSYGDDAEYINTFYFPPHPPETVLGDDPRLDVFMDFIRHLFPEDEERAWLLQWLARMIQNPGVRSFVTPINITSTTGTGRGILFEILMAMVGGHNCHDVSKDDLEGRFNGFLDKCILAVVQEIKATTGEKKYQMWERMKSLLADTVTNIQPKGKDSYTASVYANFLMFSNNLDALPIPDLDERRIYAMRGPKDCLSTQQIDRVIAWRDNADNIAALFNYFQRLPFDPSIFKRAPASETKKQMILACGGAEEGDLSEWLATKAPPVFDFEFAQQALLAFSSDFAESGVNRKLFRRKLSDKGYSSKRIRTGEERIYVYYKDDGANGNPERLRTEFEMLRKGVPF